MLRAGETTEERDLVAIESALEVRLGNEFLAAFVCSPGLERELTIGYLLSSGIVESAEEIDEVRYSGNRCTVRMKENARLHTQRGFSQIRRFVGTECSAPEILRELRTAGPEGGGGERLHHRPPAECRRIVGPDGFEAVSEAGDERGDAHPCHRSRSDGTKNGGRAAGGMLDSGRIQRP